jgi:DHA3 family macrolide efflux protein-like MFS transporter
MFLLGQNISLLGSSLVQYAIIWHITMTTLSGFMMSLSVICSFLPAFFISPLAGVWADKYSKKLLIIASDSMIAIATLILALLFFAGYQHISLLFVALSIRSFGAGIQMPTVNAIIPEIVPSAHLLQVNGYSGSIQSLVNVGSPVLSGALLAFAPLYLIFFIDVITAVIGVSLFSLFVKVPYKKKVNTVVVSSFRDIKIGLAYIASNKFIKALFISIGAYYILISPIAFLSPLQVSRSFGNDVWRLGALEVCFSIGMIFGGLSVALLAGKKMKHTHLIITSITVVGITIFLLAVVYNFYLYLVCIWVAGVAIPHIHTPITTILQKEVDPEFRGRVFSVEMMISSSLMPLAMVLFGPLADIISIESILIASSSLMVLLLIYMITNKDFHSISA